MFLQALTVDEREKIAKIKANKDFVAKLMRDLTGAFHIGVTKMTDKKNGIECSFNNVGSSYTSRFVADAQGVKFISHNMLGYYKRTDRPELSCGALYKKYKKNEGSRADAGFLGTHGHGNFTVVIPIDPKKLDDTMKDIIQCLLKSTYVMKIQ